MKRNYLREIEPIDVEQARANFMEALQRKLQSGNVLEPMSCQGKRGKFGRIKPVKPARTRSKRTRRTQNRPTHQK